MSLRSKLLAVANRIDHMVVAVTPLTIFRRSNTESKAALIFPPAWTPGSLGDEAMIRATVAGLSSRGFGRIDILERHPNRPWGKHLVEVGSVVAQWSTGLGWRRIAKLLCGYSHLFILGADAMDGAWRVRGSLWRVWFLRMAERLGLRACALGFSFSSAPNPEVARSLAALDDGVGLFARDPLSFRRLKSIGCRNVKLVADLAFLLPPDSRSIHRSLQWAQNQRTEGRAVIGLNIGANALGGTDAKRPDAAMGVISAALERYLASNNKIAVALIPHDYRGTASDYVLCRAIFERLEKSLMPQVYIYDEARDAASIKGFASTLDACITCRMHLAIACLSSGVPVGAIVYQDKFEGLFELAGVHAPTLRWSEQTSCEDVYGLIDQTVQQAKMHRAILVEQLPRLKALSQSNFDFALNP
jgi:colanic acid/amylovoran biosynthesis protein